MRLTQFIICCLFLFICLTLSAQTDEQIFITFRVDVDKLRVRASPDKNAKVVAELPEHTQLKYLNETAGNWDEIELRGKKHKARWYKVEGTDMPVKGWVYGGAVVLSSVFVDSVVTIPNLNYDFFTLKEISGAEYDAVFAIYNNQIEQDSLEHQLNDSTLVFKFENGKVLKLISFETPESDNMEQYYYAGKINAAHQYVIEATYYEAMDLTMLDTRTGQETVLDFGTLPAISTDNQWIAAGWGEPYEEMGGIQLYKNTKNGIAAFMSATFARADCLDFCWNKSGDIFFKNRYYSDEGQQVKYYRMQLPVR